ncbi:chloride channel protein [Porphyromonas asaccharolytica]|uniref:Cl-channel voltage-gated family protein n=1 Tax=Porphyromonas asaccharolytica (strain ATCC 25260 / DSM 20707 / BCRC 10618 / CCUG 7834 / JCM 6326 / LMG 13178 / VPI 4198 / B440) TaxID=879243 RepID=F4KMX5_PORAD|nr:chloride channel protein [Porphyromonas asaccharolytica]AEE13353.1 Cl- channel voltage-gated family protein [Porphyromonas asaccharolytica DSM 20707]
MTTTTTRISLLQRFILWREAHISERIFVLILSFIIGILTALAAFALKQLIGTIQHLLMPAIRQANVWYLILPPIGVLLTAGVVKLFIRDDISHGVTKVLGAMSQRKSRIKPHNTWSSLLASSITIGFGGSVGAESPIVMTGAAIGSNTGRLFKLEQRQLMLLVGCGAAGAIAGIFKAPIAGLVFVVEVLLLDLTLSSVLPLLISSVTSATMAYLLTGQQAMFSFYQSDPFTAERIPYVILLGIACGFTSLYFSKVMFALESWLKRRSNFLKRYGISMLILSVAIFLFPPLFGEGYNTLSDLMAGQYSSVTDNSIFDSFGSNYWVIFAFLLCTMLVKVFASVATNSGGGCGGLFAPSLFVGGLCGFVFAYALNFFPFIEVYLPQKNFVLMGMAGVMAGVMHAPLTGTFLIAELTGGYNLLLPLMLVAICSYGTIRIFMPHSIYSLRLAQQGKLMTHSKDQAVLTVMSIDNVIETDFDKVYPDMTLGELVQVVGRAKRNLFPVVERETDKLLGVVSLDDIRNIMFRPELYDRYKVDRIMVSPPARIQSDMHMDHIMHLFDETKAWNLPVVTPEGQYLGYVSKSKIFNTYREVLNVLSPDE